MRPLQRALHWIRDMTSLLKLPTWADDAHVFAVIETPRGSTCKLDFDPELGIFALAKPLMAGLSYRYDWGFIPSTKAKDGDPLDVLVIHDAQTYPCVLLRCKPVGILELEQKSKNKKERNDRVFAVPDRSPLESDLKEIRHLPARAHKELEKFFLATNALEDKELEFLRGPKQAVKTIKRLSKNLPTNWRQMFTHPRATAPYALRYIGRVVSPAPSIFGEVHIERCIHEGRECRNCVRNAVAGSDDLIQPQFSH
jgi:inorganic pyrophosphatase